MNVTPKRAAVALAAGAALIGDAAAGAAGATRCSVYTVPSLEAGPIAQTTVTPGAPYVLVCVDAAGHELVNEIVLITGGTP